MDEKNIHQEEKEDLINEDMGKEELEKDDLEENTNEDTKQDNVEDITSKLEEKKLKEELDQMNDQYLRLQAEYTNYRRRTQQEKETIGLYANEKIMQELILVIDNMERALESFEDKEDAMYKGVDLVYKQLKDTLEKNGLEEIEAENQEFDPNLHLAVMQESVEGGEPNKVTMVLQKGYKLGNKVIRATMVKVSC